MRASLNDRHGARSGSRRARAAPRTNQQARNECVTRSSHKPAISIVFRQALYLLKHTWKASRCLEIPTRRSKVRASGQPGEKKKADKHERPLHTHSRTGRGVCVRGNRCACACNVAWVKVRLLRSPSCFRQSFRLVDKKISAGKRFCSVA